LGFGADETGAMGSTLLWLAADAASKPTTNVWTVSSDIRLKHKIRDYTEGLDTILKIKPIRYAYNGKAQMPKDSEGIGIDAAAHREILPDCIGTRRDDLDGEMTDLYTFNSHAITFMMINAFKELSKRIERLEGRI
jgi:hypothetical protein